MRELILNEQKLIELCNDYDKKEEDQKHEKRMKMLENWGNDESERLSRNDRFNNQSSDQEIIYSNQ